MKNNFWLSVIVALIIGGVIGWFLGSSQAVNKTSQSVNNTMVFSNKAVGFKSDMRKLWEDHITWTRMYIISQAYDNPDGNIIAARLLKNQEDIGNSIKPYYGDDAGNKLTQLLKDHITGAVDLIKAAKANDQNALTAANDKWYANGNDIADFLSNANPNWPNDQARSMMKEHLDLTKQEAVDTLGNKYDASIADYNKVHEQILVMADMLSSGIMKQFPEKF